MKRSLYLCTLCAVSLCALLAPARAAEVTLAQLLTGKVAPQTITIKDCTPEWMKFTADLSSGIQAEDLRPMFVRAYQNEEMAVLFSQQNTYYSKGETVTCDGETLLIAYRQANPIASAMEKSLRNGLNREFNIMDELVLTPDTPLRLCLLNVKSISSLTDVQPVDTVKELDAIAAALSRARERAQQTQSISNLKQLVMSALMYAQENDEMLPTLKLEVTGVEEMNVPEQITRHPATKQPYHANQKLSEVGLGEIKDPTITPIFYEATPWNDGKRHVAFCDGHVELIANDQWVKLQREWNLQ